MTALLSDPQAWLAFATLAVLEIVLGVDNIIFLTILVSKLPHAQQRSARISGLALAMCTRIGLLYSIVWLTRLTQPLHRGGVTAAVRPRPDPAGAAACSCSPRASLKSITPWKARPAATSRACWPVSC